MVQEVDACCPRCQRALPPVPLRTVVHASGKRTLRLEIVPMLDEAWWAAAREGHPRCVPGSLEPVEGEVLEG